MFSLLYVISSFFGDENGAGEGENYGRRSKKQKKSASNNFSTYTRHKIDGTAARRRTARTPSPDEEEESEFTLEDILSAFHLDNGTLKRMMARMNRQMTNGLIGGLKKSTIAMLPSFVPILPDGSEAGKYLAMDLGGTNLRVMLMVLEDGKEPLSEQRNYRIPNSVMTGTGRQLFDFIVKSLGVFLEEKNLMEAGLSLGFTFSYPCDQTSLKSAKLLRWTKGFNASGVEGQDVVDILEDAIKRHGKIKVKVTALINDTVGTQVATANTYKECDIGVIIATGTNCSYMEDVSNLKKLNGIIFPFEKMIIDTEWGGFADKGEADYIKTEFDKIVDARSVHPGVQSFDKLVAGMYMGELVRLVLEKLVEHNLIFKGIGSELIFKPGTFPTKYISEILGDESGYYNQTRIILDELCVDDYMFSDILLLREVCMAVSRRSANLAAAAIACVMNRIEKKRVTIGIDGSTYKYHPFYHFWVKDKVRELIPNDVEFQLVQAGDGSGKGAALVAALADKMKIEEQKQNQEQVEENGPV